MITTSYLFMSLQLRGEPEGGEVDRGDHVCGATSVAVPGKARWNGVVGNTTSAIATAFDKVGPRRRQLWEVGDPGIRLKVNGVTVLALTRSPGGSQAWKIVVPASTSGHAPKAHQGCERLFVFSGRIGPHDGSVHARAKTTGRKASVE
jgi:hypothetical protein